MNIFLLQFTLCFEERATIFERILMTGHERVTDTSPGHSMHIGKPARM